MLNVIKKEKLSCCNANLKNSRKIVKISHLKYDDTLARAPISKLFSLLNCKTNFRTDSMTICLINFKPTSIFKMNLSNLDKKNKVNHFYFLYQY